MPGRASEGCFWRLVSAQLSGLASTPPRYDEAGRRCRKGGVGHQSLHGGRSWSLHGGWSSNAQLDHQATNHNGRESRLLLRFPHARPKNGIPHISGFRQESSISPLDRPGRGSAACSRSPVLGGTFFLAAPRLRLGLLRLPRGPSKHPQKQPRSAARNPSHQSSLILFTSLQSCPSSKSAPRSTSSSCCAPPRSSWPTVSRPAPAPHVLTRPVWAQWYAVSTMPCDV
jgi:hypothetical protein